MRVRYSDMLVRSSASEATGVVSRLAAPWRGLRTAGNGNCERMRTSSASSAASGTTWTVGTVSPAAPSAARWADLSVSLTAVSTLWNGSPSSAASRAVQTRSSSSRETAPSTASSRSSAATSAMVRPEASTIGPVRRSRRCIEVLPGCDESTTHTSSQTPFAASTIDSGAGDIGW